MITIPIIKRIYEEDGEIKFEVLGEKDVPLELLEKINQTSSRAPPLCNSEVRSSYFDSY